MDIQFWIWVAVIVLSLLARANKNKKRSGGAPEGMPGQPEVPAEKPMTFEELLREIEASRQPAKPKPVPVVAQREVEVVDYDNDLKDEAEDLETIPDYRKEDAIYDVYEKAKKEAFSRPSLEETTKLEDTIVRFGQFKGYQKQDNKVVISDYLKDFHDREGLKKAFVMSEVLKRRF
jgi:hypothetical protein